MTKCLRPVLFLLLFTLLGVNKQDQYLGAKEVRGLRISFSEGLRAYQIALYTSAQTAYAKADDTAANGLQKASPTPAATAPGCISPTQHPMLGPDICQEPSLRKGVNHTFEDSEHDLWYATDNGVWYHNKVTNQWTGLLTASDRLSRKEGYRFLVCNELKPNLIIAAGYMSGIYLIHKPTLKTKFLKANFVNPGKYIREIYYDRNDSTLWVGTEQLLANICFRDKLCINFIEQIKDIHHIIPRDENHLWLKTTNHLFLFNKLTHEKEIFALPKEELHLNLLYRFADSCMQAMAERYQDRKTIMEGREKDGKTDKRFLRTTGEAYDYCTKDGEIKLTPLDIVYPLSMPVIASNADVTHYDAYPYTSSSLRGTTPAHNNIQATGTFPPMLYIMLPWSFLIAIVAFIFKRTITTTDTQQVSSQMNVYANTVHDMRTPLSMIKAPLEELKSKHDLPESQKRAVDMALKNTDAIYEMTNRLVNNEMGNSPTGVHLTYEKLNNLFDAPLERMQMMAEAKNQEVEIRLAEADIEVYTDIYRIHAIFQNILTNAIKYTPPEGKIVITLYVNASLWGFRITDSGIGMKTSEVPKLFKKKFRGTNARTSSIEGSGIGLFSVSRFITQLQGTINVQSALNRGSTFDICFPLNDQPYSRAVTKDVSPLPTAKSSTKRTIYTWKRKPKENRTHILIVEDNTDLLTFLKEHFRAHYQVYTATNASEALEEVERVHPLVIISDVGMPGMNGDMLCQKIKNNRETSHIGVILLSGFNDHMSIIKGLTAKADAYITKPFNIHVLEMNVHNLIETRRLLQDHLVQSFQHAKPMDENINSETEMKFVQDLKRIIEKHLHEPDFGVDTLAMELHMSRTGLYNKLRTMSNQSPLEFIRLCRINKAKYLLQQHKYSINEIATMVGFADTKYFRTIFKQLTGKSPNEYCTYEK